MWPSSKNWKYFDDVIGNQCLKAPNFSLLEFYYFFNSNPFTCSFYLPLPYDRKWSFPELLFEYDYSIFFKVYIRFNGDGDLFWKLFNRLIDRFRYYWMVLLRRWWSLMSQIVQKHLIRVVLMKLGIFLNVLIEIYGLLSWFLFHSIIFISSSI